MATLHNLRSKSPPVAPEVGAPPSASGRNFDDADMPPALPEDSTGGMSDAAEPQSEPSAGAGMSSASAGRIYNDFETMRDWSETAPGYSHAPMEMADRPQGISGVVAKVSDTGVAVLDRSGDALTYVPLVMFGEPPPAFQVGHQVSLVLEERDGVLQAVELDRIGPVAPVAAPDVATQRVAGRDVADAESTKEDEGLSSASSRHRQTPSMGSNQDTAELARQVAENLRQQGFGGGGGGGGAGSLLDDPRIQKTAIGTLAASAVLATGIGGIVPALAAGVLAAGGGSVALEGLKRASAGVQQAVEARRVRVSDTLAKNVNSLAADIERDTNWLRAHGMESVVTQMKDTGRSLREVLPELQRGGALEHLGFQMKGMLADPEFAQRYEALEANLDRFGIKADRYAKTMIAAGRDPEAFLEAASEHVSKSVEGLPIEKDGKFSALSDKVAEMVESIKAVISKMMGRLTPGRS